VLRIVVASQKGGVGKTSIATNLAACLAGTGRRTALLDCDELAGSLAWGQMRSGNLPRVHVSGIARGAPGIRSWGFHVPSDTQRLVVDAPGNVKGFELQDLVSRADVLIVPCLPSRLDLAVTLRFLDKVEVMGRVRHGRALPTGIVLNRFRRRALASREAEKSIHTWRHEYVARLAESQLYPRAAGVGCAVAELDGTRIASHRQHWRQLVDWVEHQHTTTLKPDPVVNLANLH